MSAKTLEKIDKFYIVLAVVLLFMALMIIMSFKGVFSAFLTAYDLDQQAIGQEVRLNSEELDEVYTWVYNRKADDLLVR
jgi:cell division protein FtsL